MSAEKLNVGSQRRDFGALYYGSGGLVCGVAGITIFLAGGYALGLGGVLLAVFMGRRALKNVRAGNY